MPNLGNLRLDFDVDAVLRGQGADPQIMRARRPNLVALAEKAMQEALPLIEPKVIYREFEVREVRHERVIFEGGGQLSGALLPQHFGKARRVYALLCTVGPAIGERAAEAWDDSPTYSLALEGAGAAAVEALANAACAHLERLEEARGWQTSIPLSPGMIDWPVEQGQPQIFRLLEGEAIPVELTPSFIMVPTKSLTMVVGAGPEMSTAGRTCDYCALRDACRYQDHYQQAQGAS